MLETNPTTEDLAMACLVDARGGMAQTWRGVPVTWLPHLRRYLVGSDAHRSRREALAALLAVPERREVAQ